MLLKMGAAFAVALGVAALLPRDGSTSQPPVGYLLAVAVLVTAVMAAALFAGLRYDLGLPLRIVLYAVAWNALVIVVKLAIAPYGMYEVNRAVTFDFTGPDDLFYAMTSAVLVLALYALAYRLIYRIVVREAPPGTRGGGWARRRWRTALLVGLLAVAVMGTGLFLVPLIVFVAGIQYIEFVFSSSVSLLVAGALAVATALVTTTFRDARDQAAAVGDATVLVTLFWVGLAFLALYHVLWVVYILVLTATWPLRTVFPK